MLKKFTLAVFVLICLFNLSAVAQTASGDKKQAAVKQLVFIINSDRKSDDLIKGMLPVMQETQNQSLKTMLAERADLSADEKLALEKTMREDNNAIMKQMMEKFINQLDYEKTLNQITEIIYDKYYSLAELKDLITFYQTPTGQKTIKLITPISIETMRLSQQKIAPKMQITIKEIMDEFRADMERRLNSQKPKP